MPVRNEAWCLGFTLRVALRWCDEVVVMVHSCQDESHGIAREVFGETKRVGFAHDFDPQWNEMLQRNCLLSMARERGATHIALVDADEFLTGDLLRDIRGLVERCGCGTMLELPGYNCRDWKVGDYRMYHTNGVWGQRWFATAFQDTPAAHWGGDQFHHREPFGVGWNRWKAMAQGQGGTLHLWGASERRLRAKHALYKITERLRWPNKAASEIEYTYDPATNPESEMACRMRVNGPWTFAPVKPEWLEPYQELMQYLDIDAEPWQVGEVKRLVQEYGAERFIGLDLLGVPEW